MKLRREATVQFFFWLTIILWRLGLALVRVCFVQTESDKSLMNEIEWEIYNITKRTHLLK